MIQIVGGDKCMACEDIQLFLKRRGIKFSYTSRFDNDEFECVYDYIRKNNVRTGPVIMVNKTVVFTASQFKQLVFDDKLKDILNREGEEQ